MTLDAHFASISRPTAAAILRMTLTECGPTNSIAVLAHRGARLDRPENTIPAYRSAVEVGANFIEIDIRTTSDGRLVLMHDRTVDCTTTGAGLLAGMAFAEIRALGTGKDFPAFQGTIVATIDEAMDVIQGAGTGRLSRLQGCERRTACRSHRMTRAQRSCRELCRQGSADTSARATPRLKAMPEAESPAVLKDLISTLHLDVAAFDDHDFK